VTNTKNITKRELTTVRKCLEPYSPKVYSDFTEKNFNKKVSLSLGATGLRALLEIIVIRETES